MIDIDRVLFGAAVGFVAALIGEAIKRRRASQVAAMMVLRELDFHEQRLNTAIVLDVNPQAEYMLQFPAPVWSAQSGVLLAGASPRASESLLNWYATLTVLGNQIGKQVGPDGAVLVGPDRSRMATALSEARDAAMKIASRSLFWSYHSNQQSLFTANPDAP